MRKIKFATDQIYHIYNHGVEKRDLFVDDKDYLRFIHDLFEFNDTRPAIPSNIKFASRKPKNDIQSAQIQQCLETKSLNIVARERLVNLFAFCLMPNHFHLLAQPKCDKGIEKFMLKLGAGYATYFNQKYKRSGRLFQSTFKATTVERDAYFLHIPNYIHCNPLKLIMPDWRTSGVKDKDQAMNFLENYRWSSLPDYIGKKNFPSLTQRELFLDTYGSPMAYKENIIQCLETKSLNIELSTL